MREDTVHTEGLPSTSFHSYLRYASPEDLKARLLSGHLSLMCDKVAEERAEFDAEASGIKTDEFGDILLALINVVR